MSTQSINNDLSEVTKDTLTTEDLEAGGTLPRDMFEEFWYDLQEQSELLGRVRTETIESAKTRIPKFHIGERVRRGQSEAEEGNQATFNTDHIDIDAEKGSVYWSLSSETVEDNPQGEALAEQVLDRMETQFSADTQDLGINGDEDSDEGFEQQNTGWIELADGEMPTFDNAGDEGSPQSLTVDSVFGAISTLEAKYRGRTDPVFLTSRDQVLDFHNSMIDRDTPLGDAVLMGEDEVTPFNYDIVGISMWPDDTAMFTDPENLVYALNRDVEIDVLQQSDDIHDLDLFAKYALRARDDFAIENTDAGVLVENIAEPFAE